MQQQQLHPARLSLRRQVSLEEGDSKARELSVNFIETSAKAGFNIKVSVLVPCHCLCLAVTLAIFFTDSRSTRVCGPHAPYIMVPAVGLAPPLHAYTAAPPS